MPNLKLIISIINFLKEEGNRSDMNDDTKESLEVAVQCLQTAYDIDDKDCESPEKAMPFSIEEIFQSACLSFEDDGGSNSDKIQKAEVMKHLGNNLMKSNQFALAVKYYTAAIDLDKNAIYYGNRAAAYSKLNDFQNAIIDCEKAIEIEPKYAKAYGRMGLAYASLEQHDQAIKAFKQSVELDPNNESYRSNLKIALEKKDKPSSNPAGGPGGLSGLRNVDWRTLFTNPTFRNMASTLIQDPNIINAMASSLNQGSPNDSQPTGSGDASTGPVPNIGVGAGGPHSLDVLMEATQYLAAQMAAANPDLVEQFRESTARAFTRQNPDDSSTQ